MVFSSMYVCLLYQSMTFFAQVDIEKVGSIGKETIEYGHIPDMIRPMYQNRFSYKDGLRSITTYQPRNIDAQFRNQSWLALRQLRIEIQSEAGTGYIRFQ
jgi:hypothetical protein